MACAATTGLQSEERHSLRESDMIRGDLKKNEPTPSNDNGADEHDDELPVKLPRLGELKTEEEDRLAAEIEKLRR
jgi:hypothetical protein